jgi:hypothetical protein
MRTLAVTGTFVSRAEAARSGRGTESSRSPAVEFAAAVRRWTVGMPIATSVAVGARFARTVVIRPFVPWTIFVRTIGTFLRLDDGVDAEQQGQRGRRPFSAASEKSSSHRFVFLFERLRSRSFVARVDRPELRAYALRQRIGALSETRSFEGGMLARSFARPFRRSCVSRG